MPSAREFWVTTTCTRSRDTLAINLASQGSWPGDTEIHCALICKDLSLRVNSCMAFNMICSNSSLRGIWSGPTMKTNKQKNGVSYKNVIEPGTITCLSWSDKLLCYTFLYVKKTTCYSVDIYPHGLFLLFHLRSLCLPPPPFFFLLQIMKYSTSLLAFLPSATGGTNKGVGKYVPFAWKRRIKHAAICFCSRKPKCLSL